MITQDMLFKGSNYVDEILRKLRRVGGAITLYGAGYCGHEALSLLSKHNITVKTICDDFRVGQYLDGIRITDIKSVVPSEELKIFITSGFNQKMKAKLQELSLIDYYHELDFGRYDPEKENYEYFADHIDEINAAYSLLTDEFSKKLFLNLVNYRISRDISLLDGMQESTPQYFPEYPDLRSNQGHYFLDLGAYNGDSISAFLDYTGGFYGGIYAFEASRKNYEILVNNTRNMHDVQCFYLAVSDKKELVSFNVSDAKNSFADEHGQIKLQADSVDNVLAGKPVTFIKMDVEGAEFKALNGAEYTIKTQLPVMAVSVYHFVEDLFRLQLLIEEFCPGLYDFYLRHYSPTVIETVLYAIPKVRRNE